MKKFLVLLLLVLSLFCISCNGDINNNGNAENNNSNTDNDGQSSDNGSNKNNEVAYLDFKSLDSEIMNSEFPAFVNSAYFIARIPNYLYDLVPSSYLQGNDLFAPFTEEAVQIGTIDLNDNIGQVVVKSATEAEFNINLTEAKTVVIEDNSNGYRDTLIFNGKLTYSRQTSQVILSMENFYFEMARIDEGVDLGTTIKVENISGDITAKVSDASFTYDFNVGNVYFNTSKFDNYTYIFEMLYSLMSKAVYTHDFVDDSFELTYIGSNYNSYTGTYTLKDDIYSLSGVYSDESSNLKLNVNMDMKLIPRIFTEESEPSYYKISILNMDIDGINIGQNVIDGSVETI